MTDIGKNILKLLISYDIFDFPSQFLDIYCRLKDNTITNDELAAEINFLISKKNIFKNEGHFLPLKVKEIINKKIEAKTKAFTMMIKAYKNAFLISKFPFVRAVFLSGSIMKGYADENTNIDYFIVTKKNRLWIARTLLLIYKKFFLKKTRKYFCLNYFIDQDDLEIQDKDLFMATELINLVPVYNYGELSKLFGANVWILRYYTKFPVWKESEPFKINYSLKNFIEFLIDNKIGDLIDNLLLKISVLTIKKKLHKTRQHVEMTVFKNIRFSKHECKYHRSSFRKNLLDNYNLKKVAFGEEFNISMN